MPIIAGTKVNGRVGNTNFGGLVVGTDEEPGVGGRRRRGWRVGRVKQNIWRESWVGAIATVGDPLGRPGSWLGGADFTYADLALPRRQELPRRRVGARDRSRGPRAATRRRSASRSTTRTTSGTSRCQ